MSSYSIINTFAASKSLHFLKKIKFHGFLWGSVFLLLEFNKLLERKKQFAPKVHSDVRDSFIALISSGTCGLQWQVTKLRPSTATLRQTKQQLGIRRQCSVWHTTNIRSLQPQQGRRKQFRTVGSRVC